MKKKSGGEQPFAGWKQYILLPWPALIFIALAALLIYSNIYHSPFVFDDIKFLHEGPIVRSFSSFDSLREFFSRRSITKLSFAINYYLGETEVTGYHLVNVVIHVINGWLVFFLTLEIWKRLVTTGSSTKKTASLPALLAALIFVCHPIQTQAVTYTIQRMASMACIFYLGAVLFYIKGRTAFKARSGRWRSKGSIYTCLAVGCALIALLCKENTGSLPGVILVVEFLFFDRTWAAWKRKLPWITAGCCLWALYILFVFGVFTGTPGESAKLLYETTTMLINEGDEITRWKYLCTQFNVIVIYIRLLLLPMKQNLDYCYPIKTGFFDGWTPAAFLFLTSILLAGIAMWKKHPLVTLAISWFFITLSIESSIIPISDALYEHRLYLPMFAFAVLVPYLLLHIIPMRRKTVLAIAIVLITGLGTATYLRNMDWQDDVAFWRDVIEKAPHNYRAYNNLGFSLVQSGRAEEAISYYEKSITINPKYLDPYLNLGLACFETGEKEKALVLYRKVLALNPKYVKAHNSLGLALHDAGDYPGAIKAFTRAVDLKPNFSPGHYNRGVSLLASGRPEEAIAAFEKAIELDPAFAAAVNNMGVALSKLGRKEEAITLFERAIELKPDYADAYVNFGVTRYKAGKLDEAVTLFSTAIELDPDNPDGYFNWAAIQNTLGDQEKAISLYRSGLERDPRNTEALFKLGKLFTEWGNRQEAINTLIRVIDQQPGHDRACFILGNLYSDQRNYQKAIELYEQAIAANAGNVEAYYNCGNAYFKQGNNGQAIVLYKKAIELFPEHASAHKNLAIAYYQTGNFAQAIRHCDRAKALGSDLQPEFIKALEPYR